MGCGQDCMKWFLIGLNTIFALMGIALLGIGGYVMVEMSEYSVRIFS